MNKTVFLALTALFFSGSVNLYFLYGKQHKESTQKQTAHVAILSPISHPAITEIEQGCIETLEASKQVQYIHTVFNANGNTSLMRSEAEEILNGGYDAVFTIGVQATQTMRELTHKKQMLLPIVFSSVDETFKEGLHKESLSNITGAYDKPHYKQQLELLAYIKPETKQLLLVYSPAYGPSLQADIQFITEQLNKLNIQTHLVHVSDISELQAKITPFISEADVLLILKDHIPVTGIDVLIKLCNTHGVTLYASDLNSGYKGAALAYGIREFDSGAQAGYKIQQIVEAKKAPSDIPMTAIPHLKLCLNTATMEQQGLTLDPHMITLMRQGCTCDREDKS